MGRRRRRHEGRATLALSLARRAAPPLALTAALWLALSALAVPVRGTTAGGTDMHPDSPAASGGAIATLSGYARALSGETIEYHSPLPGQRAALIARALDAWPAIVWETGPTAKEGADSLRFAWLAGLGCNLGEPAFTLTAGDLAPLEFRPLDRDTWTVRGEQGQQLSFRGLLRDHYGDRFGLMFLQVPREAVAAGAPLRIAIAGRPEGSRAWVMTFTEPLERGVTLEAPALVLRAPDGPRQPIRATVLHLEAGADARPAEITLAAPGADTLRAPLVFGFNRYELALPCVERETSVTVDVGLPAGAVRGTVTLRPVRRWAVDLVQHAHTDVGYTRPQAEILAEHLRYIDDALDYCDATDAYPEEARFRWTCETSWAVREYLRVRPPVQIERLVERVREGRIELTAMPLNLGEIADENILVASLGWLREARARDLPVTLAMQNDVNGFAWSLLDALPGLGIRFVTMGENPHRALRPFDSPTAFWWESPAGARVLALRNDHYMTGDFLGLLQDRTETLGDNLLLYLGDLERRGFEGSEIAIQYSGYFTDNAPPSLFANESVRRWNERYLWPRLRTSTMGAFLERLAAERGDSLSVHRAGWPDWWTDGFGSAMRETGAVRRAQAELTAVQVLLLLLQARGLEPPPEAPRRLETVRDLIVFYDEHTFGAAESISDPLAENSQVQWLTKASYAWQAVTELGLLREQLLGWLQPAMPRERPLSVIVANTLNWERPGLMEIFVDHQVLPRDARAEIVGEEGERTALQWLAARGEGSRWAAWVAPRAPLSVSSLAIETLPPAAARAPEARETQKEEAGTPREVAPAGVLENDWYRISVDPAGGGIVSLFDKELELELLDARGAWPLGAVIRETLADRASMEQLRLGDHRREVWSAVRLSPGAEGPIWRSVRLEGHLPGCAGVACEVRLYETAKRIELVHTVRKLPVTDPEALYVALPFDLPGGRIAFEAQGAVIEPGVDQLPGTASDWNTVQSFAAVRNDRAQIVVVSPEAPLMQFGAINTGRYQREARPASNRIFSWVLNNYWVTNFRASQEGDLTWRTLITSANDPSNAFATRFGWEARVPLPARVLARGRTAEGPAAGGGGSTGGVEDAGGGTASAGAGAPVSIDLGCDHVLLAGVHPDPQRGGFILHLRELDGRPATIRPRAGRGLLALEEVDALGGGARPVSSVDLPPFGVRFVRVAFPARR